LCEPLWENMALPTLSTLIPRVINDDRVCLVVASGANATSLMDDIDLELPNHATENTPEGVCDRTAKKVTWKRGSGTGEDPYRYFGGFIKISVGMPDNTTEFDEVHEE